MPRRTMPPAERAARDVMKPYVRDGVISQGVVNQIIRGGLALTEVAVRESYTPGQTFMYANKIAAARAAYDGATTSVARMVHVRRVMAAEMFAAVYKAVQTERGDAWGPMQTMPMDQAETVMRTVRDTAAAVREEARADGQSAAAA